LRTRPPLDGFVVTKLATQASPSIGEFRAEPGQAKDWWGTVTGFQPPGAIDFHHTIHVSQLRATVDVRIHYSFERDGPATQATRWLVLDITMPMLFRPARRLIIKSFDDENVRTMAAVKTYAEAHPDGIPSPPAS
jgi:hypothetical protein